MKTFQVMSRKKRMEDIVQKKQLISEEMLRIVTISEMMLIYFDTMILAIRIFFIVV